MTSLIVNESGEIAIPQETRERYHLTPHTPGRVIEMRSGILLVPLTEEPMSSIPELERELADWQALSADSWAMYPYKAL